MNGLGLLLLFLLVGSKKSAPSSAAAPRERVVGSKTGRTWFVAKGGPPGLGLDRGDLMFVASIFASEKGNDLVLGIARFKDGTGRIDNETFKVKGFTVAWFEAPSSLAADARKDFGVDTPGTSKL